MRILYGLLQTRDIPHIHIKDTTASSAPYMIMLLRNVVETIGSTGNL